MIYGPGLSVPEFSNLQFRPEIKFIKGCIDINILNEKTLEQDDDKYLMTRARLGWCISVVAVGSNMSASSRRARSELTEIDSRMFGLEDVTFLTPNNTALLAHQGSTVTLSCRLTKTPNFGMVRIRNDFETFAKETKFNKYKNEFWFPGPGYI